jgi:hypothetical protein
MAKVSKQTLAALQVKTPQNISEVTARYCALMEEIKDRTNAIRLILGGKVQQLHWRIGIEL